MNGARLVWLGKHIWREKWGQHIVAAERLKEGEQHVFFIFKSVGNSMLEKNPYSAGLSDGKVCFLAAISLLPFYLKAGMEAGAAVYLHHYFALLGICILNSGSHCYLVYLLTCILCKACLHLEPSLNSVYDQSSSTYFRRIVCRLEVRSWKSVNQFFNLTFYWNKSCSVDSNMPFTSGL